MFKLLPAAVLLLLSASEVTSAATEYTLLPLVPDDAGSVVGFDAGRMLNSHFGQRILEKMQAADPRLKILLNLGLDPKDIRQVVVAGGGEEHKSLILVSGKFPSKQLVSGLIATLIPSSGNKATYEGVDLISGGDGTAFAFADEQTLIVGPDALIRTAIDRRKRKPMALQSAAARRGAALLDKSAKWHAYDLWFASSGPTSDFTGRVGQSATGGVLNEGVLKAFDRTYGGLRFTDALEVGVETAARTEKDAASMVKIMKVLSALSALTKGATSGPLGFLDSLDIRADANVVNFSLKIPRAAFDAMHPAVP